MGSAGNAFADCGPMHMMTKFGAASSPTTVEIDWDNEEHRRCITACLVKGTYLLESQRTSLEVDTNSEQLAPAWWESFHFRRHRVLACVCECVLCRAAHHIHGTRGAPFIYGAIFEYVPPDDGAAARRHPSTPSYVVAIRGTMLRDPTTFGDMCLNLRILLNEQHFCGRFSHARTKVEELLSSIPKNGGGAGGVWLAGHSLGASIALDVGRHIMTEEELKLPTFLFNPPQVSLASLAPAISKLPVAAAAKKGVHASSSAVKHVLGKTVLRPHRRKMEEKFQRLAPWVPNLYVHPRDVICTGFIDYFEQRERHPRLAASATVMSYRDVCRSAVGRQNDRPHLLPSAVLWKNQSSQGDPHELRQWWQPQGPELDLTGQLYKWS